MIPMMLMMKAQLTMKVKMLKRQVEVSRFSKSLAMTIIIQFCNADEDAVEQNLKSKQLSPQVQVF